MDKTDEAVDLFGKGYACSQAILAVYGEPLGVDRELAVRIAAGFAGGMRTGGTCGAVTGAMMVLGLWNCGVDCDCAVDRKPVCFAVTDFVAQFEERNGSTICSDLLGCDIATPDGMQSAQSRGVFRTICPQMVRDAAEILDQML